MEHTSSEIADAYLDHLMTRSPDSQWAVDRVIDLKYESRWDVIWEVVLTIARREEEIPVEALAVVAAGPLEDLICSVGPEYIDRIEHEAKVNRRLGYLLTGVWPTSARPEIRDRVVAFCREFPEPMDGTYGF